MKKEEADDLNEVDALCKECGHAFKVYIDRVTAGRRPGPDADHPAECPVCGCGDCRIGQ